MTSSHSLTNTMKTYQLCVAVPELPRFVIKFEHENRMDVICIYEDNTNILKKKEFLSTKIFRGTILTCFLFQGIDKSDVYIYDDLKQYCTDKTTVMTSSVKLLHMKNIMEQNNITCTSVVLYLPVMWNNTQNSHDLFLLSDIPYHCTFVCFHSLYNILSPMKLSYEVYDRRRQQICIDLELTDTCRKQKEERLTQIFEVIPQCQPDIYYLYTTDNLGNSVFHSVACITSYKLSCEMNFIFRCIHNKNIDWIEESDSEHDSTYHSTSLSSIHELESVDSDIESVYSGSDSDCDCFTKKRGRRQRKKNKYNDIHVKYESTKRVLMICYYHVTFNKWIPIQVY